MAFGVPPDRMPPGHGVLLPNARTETGTRGILSGLPARRSRMGRRGILGAVSQGLGAFAAGAASRRPGESHGQAIARGFAGGAMGFNQGLEAGRQTERSDDLREWAVSRAAEAGDGDLGALYQMVAASDAPSRSLMGVLPALLASRGRGGPTRADSRRAEKIHAMRQAILQNAGNAGVLARLFQLDNPNSAGRLAMDRMGVGPEDPYHQAWVSVLSRGVGAVNSQQALADALMAEGVPLEHLIDAYGYVPPENEPAPIAPRDEPGLLDRAGATVGSAWDAVAQRAGQMIGGSGEWDDALEAELQSLGSPIPSSILMPPEAGPPELEAAPSEPLPWHGVAPFEEQMAPIEASWERFTSMLGEEAEGVGELLRSVPEDWVAPDTRRSSELGRRTQGLLGRLGVGGGRFPGQR